MRTFYSLHELLKSRVATKKLSVTLGVFDGVHRAHQKVLKAMIKKSKRNLTTLTITFYPHPANVITKKRKIPRLISLKHRLRLFEEAGVSNTLVLHFTKKLANLKYGDFAKRVFGELNISEVVVGDKFFFGKNKKGTTKDLEKLSKIYGFKLTVIKAQRAKKRTISSTWIRELILSGNLRMAASLLSRPVAVLGTVAKGEKRGRFIGFPTANVDPHHEAIPPSGVYAVRVKLDKRTYRGVLNIGTRPTFKNKADDYNEPTIEAHIFNFTRFIYGKDIEISFVRKIRSERKFSNMHNLRDEIKKDSVRAKRILS